MENDKVPIMVQKKILIVDDEKLVRWALARKCAECGYQSVEAADGEEALSLLQNESPDAILLDVHLPGRSGIEVLEKLKQRDRKSTRLNSSHSQISYAV